MVVAKVQPNQQQLLVRIHQDIFFGYDVRNKRSKSWYRSLTNDLHFHVLLDWFVTVVNCENLVWFYKLVCNIASFIVYWASVSFSVSCFIKKCYFCINLIKIPDFPILWMFIISNEFKITVETKVCNTHLILKYINIKQNKSR